MEKELSIDTLYENHIGLIKSRINKFGGKRKVHPQLWEELYSEANLLFTELYYTHDINRGKFSTYLVTSLDNHLKNIRKKLQKMNDSEVTYMGVGVGLNNSSRFNMENTHDEVFKNELYEDVFNKNYNHRDDPANIIIEKICLEQKINSLSSKDKKVVKVAMELKNTDSKYAKERTISKHSIKKYLINLGWRAVDIQRSFDRIELALFN